MLAFVWDIINAGSQIYMKVFKKILIFLLVLVFVAAILIGWRFFVIKADYKNLTQTLGSTNQENLDQFFIAAQKLQTDIKPFEPLLRFDKKLSDQSSQLDKLIENKTLILNLLGYDREKTYLMLMQNNTELRPSGGFWGAYGVLKVDHGKLVSFTTGDTYNLDLANMGKFAPPADAAEFFGDQWRLWNVNWSPDFATSVKQGLFFINQTHPEFHFDGVIGPNVDYFLELLKATGPIQVPGYTFQVDQNNFIQKMIYEPVDPAVYLTHQNDPNFITKQGEKKILLADLAKTMLDKLGQNGQMKDFAQITFDNLSRHNILLFSNESNTQDQILKLNWAGTIASGDNFLDVIDANIGSKLDFFIDKKIKIEKTDNQTYQATLTYTNTINPATNRFNQAFVSYRDFIRFYLPASVSSAKITGGQNPSDIKKDQDLNLNYVSNLIVLEPGESETIVLTWKNSSNENLQFWPQPGNHLIKEWLPMPILEVKNLTKIYRDGKKNNIALKNISFELEENDHLAIIGPNGSGKTTLIKILTQITHPDSGLVLVNSNKMTKADKQSFGLMLGNSMLYHRLTLRQNLEFFANLYSLVEPQKRIEHLAKTLGFHDRLDDLVEGLSQGLMSRVAFARAIIHEPQILILDEPTNGLDPIASDKLRELVKSYKTVIISSHNLDEVIDIANKVLVINKNRLIYFGEIEKLKKDKDLKEVRETLVRMYE